jgi:hypothetical protein
MQQNNLEKTDQVDHGRYMLNVSRLGGKMLVEGGLELFDGIKETL